MIGISVAIGDTTLFTLLAYLVDTRYTAYFGAVCAIADVAFCIAFVLGNDQNVKLKTERSIEKQKLYNI